MSLPPSVVFISYPCGDVVKVEVPEVVVPQVVIPPFVVPPLYECPEGTMADPKTYVSNLYPILNRDSMTNLADVVELAMKSIYRSFNISYESYHVSHSVVDVYLKSINISTPVVDTLNQSLTLEDVYLKSINISLAVHDALQGSSEVNAIEMINLNKYINVRDNMSNSATVLVAEMEPSPRIVLGTTFGDNIVDGFTANKASIASVAVMNFAELDKLKTSEDAITSNKAIITSVSIITYNNYVLIPDYELNGITAKKSTIVSTSTITYSPVTAPMENEDKFTAYKAIITGVSIT